MILFLIFGLVFGWPVRAIDEDTCFALNQKEIKIERSRLSPFEPTKLDPKGQKLLFSTLPQPVEIESENMEGINNLPPVQVLLPENNRDRGNNNPIPQELKSNTLVSLWDLENSEPHELFPISSSESYGFSPDGSFIWGTPPEGGIKIKYLSKQRAGQTLILLEGRTIFHFSYSDDEKDWLVIDGQKEDEDSLMRENPHGNKPIRSSAPKGPLDSKHLENSKELVFRTLDPFTLKQKAEKSLPQGMANMSCYDVNLSLNQFFYVQKEGSLLGIPLRGPGKAMAYFGPPSGFNSLNAVSKKNCAFFGKSQKSSINVLRFADKKALLIRSLKDQKEFFRQERYLFPQFLINNYRGRGYLSSFLRISYPLALREDISIREREIYQIYHIPEDRILTAPEEKVLAMDEQGRLVLQISVREKGQVLQAIFEPFLPQHRKVILEMPFREVCKPKFIKRHGHEMLFNWRKTHAFISSVWGDLYIIDITTGKVRKFSNFFPSTNKGSCFFASEISLSGETIIGRMERETPGDLYGRLDFQPVIYKFQRTCPDSPFDSSPIGIEWLKASKEGELENPAVFSRFMTALKEEDRAQNHLQAWDDTLWRLLLKSPSTYLTLTGRESPLKDLPPSAIYKTFPSDLKKRLQEKTLSLLDSKVLGSRPTRLSDWFFLLRLQPLISKFPRWKKDFYINTITESISRGAHNTHPLLGEVFQSKIFYIVRGHVQELFGEKRRPVSDITLIREPQSFSTLILSSDPIIGEVSNTETDFGLHYGLVKEASYENLISLSWSPVGTQITNHIVEWRIAGDSKLWYRGEIQVHTKKDFNKLTSAIDYPSFYRDQKMTGAIIVGSSLAQEAGYLLKEYLSYFYEQGFQFFNHETEDLKAFLTELIHCELDYFLTESHGGGDERNLFRFNKENYIVQGERWEGLKLKERIYLIIPKTSEEETETLEESTDVLSHRELGEAIAQRYDRKCGQIVYFNTGCFTDIKARYMLEAVHSPLFLNIPVRSPSWGFENREESAIYALIHSLREGKDFEGFREALKSNEDYNQGLMDYYIFPDEEIYKERVFKAIRIPLDTSVKLFVKDNPNESWRKTEPDEAL